MSIRWLLAALHLLALGIGMGAVWVRARALRGSLDNDGVRRVLAADTWWGIAAALWIGTGLFRAFGGLEKGTGYYVHNKLFLAKMGLFLLIFVLEIRPIVTFIRWRARLARGEGIDTSSAPALARISGMQTVLVVLMVLAASGMARGFGF